MRMTDESLSGTALKWWTPQGKRSMGPDKETWKRTGGGKKHKQRSSMEDSQEDSKGPTKVGDILLLTTHPCVLTTEDTEVRDL